MEDRNIYNNIGFAIIPIAYCVIADMIVVKYQSAKIKSHVENGGKLYSTSRAVWIGIVGLAFIGAIICSFTLVTGRDLW